MNNVCNRTGNDGIFQGFLYVKKAKQNTVAYFSTGDGSTNFRTPVIVDFARGGSVTSVGVYSADQNKKHNHNFGGFLK